MGTTIDVTVITQAIEARKAIDTVIDAAVRKELDLWAGRVLDAYTNDAPSEGFGVLSMHDVQVLESVMPAGTSRADFVQELTDRLTFWWLHRHGSDGDIPWEIAVWDTNQTGAGRQISVVPRRLAP